MLSSVGDGIHVVDSGFVHPGLDAIHLIVERGRVAIVDTGVNDSVPRVLAALSELTLAPEAVDWVVLTHVHLDHAGGAGLLMQQLPGARLLVHPRGARHMIDPSKLAAATAAVYGSEAARRMYGEIVPVPAAQVVSAPDGFGFELNGRVLTVIDTPGHARHHLSLVDRQAGVVFAGDTFGLSYRALDDSGRQFVVPSTTPVQFDPPALHASIDRIAALAPRAVAVTHFGPVGDVPRLAADLHRQIDALVAMAGDCARRCDPGEARRDPASSETLRRLLRDGVRELLFDEARRQGWTFDEAGLLQIFTLDIGLNADGLFAWLTA
ncbi:MAG: MBL fold metallo-hydrolase [Burkholderiaceae bacterium]